MMEDRKVGILTFYCADNYGAMLQAYGLKHYLLAEGVDAEIIRYEPAFMTGRHWWIPYIPICGICGCVWLGLKGWRRNLQKGKAFFIRRHNMKDFREKYLIKKGQKKLFFVRQLERQLYQYYIIGSDQIWNPDITLGLRRAYFGAFRIKSKKKVAIYGASLGGASLSPKFTDKFSKLLKYADEISVRESEVIPYIKQFYRGPVKKVPDPVFLLTKKEWQKIERLPDKKRYILVYMAEKNINLIKYAKRLSQEKNLPVIELRSGADAAGVGFITDYTAGPAEFLGYVHMADYIITNSFHGVAFSIIYHKNFCAFVQKDSEIRISSILRDLGLSERMYRGNKRFKTDVCIEWDKIEDHIKENTGSAKKFVKGY